MSTKDENGHIPIEAKQDSVVEETKVDKCTKKIENNSNLKHEEKKVANSMKQEPQIEQKFEQNELASFLKEVNSSQAPTNLVQDKKPI